MTKILFTEQEKTIDVMNRYLALNNSGYKIVVKKNDVVIHSLLMFLKQAFERIYNGDNNFKLVMEMQQTLTEIEALIMFNAKSFGEFNHNPTAAYELIKILNT